MLQWTLFANFLSQLALAWHKLFYYATAFAYSPHLKWQMFRQLVGLWAEKAERYLTLVFWFTFTNYGCLQLATFLFMLYFLLQITPLVVYVQAEVLAELPDLSPVGDDLQLESLDQVNVTVNVVCKMSFSVSVNMAQTVLLCYWTLSQTILCTHFVLKIQRYRYVATLWHNVLSI